MHRDDEIALASLAAIYRAAVEQVNPEYMIRSCLSLVGDALRVSPPSIAPPAVAFMSGTAHERPFEHDGQATLLSGSQDAPSNAHHLHPLEHSVSYDLSAYRSIKLMGIGKGAIPMAAGVVSVLGNRVSEGLVSVRHAQGAALEGIGIIEAGHPVPDENSERAAREFLRMAEECDSRTLVIFLVSGGGSSLLALPWSREGFPPALTLEEKRETTRLLLGSGAPIAEINCVRRHISEVKGGRLAEALFPAHCLTLILSDVIGDPLDSIASGPTAPDKSTYRDAHRILESYRIWDSLPPHVRELITAGMTGRIPETPKPGNPLFLQIRNILIGSNRIALQGAAEKARELGFAPIILSSSVQGEAREIAKFYAALALEASRSERFGKRPVCLIGGGETTVTIRGPGQGGRNQEMALSFLNEMAASPDSWRGIYFLAAGTDGIDGPTDAAGAFAFPGLVPGWSGTVSGRGHEVEPWERTVIGRFLDNNDSYRFFDAAGGLFKTGPTNTNVCDIHLALVL